MTGCPGAGKAGKSADFGKWAGKAGNTYTFRCPEAGKAGKKVYFGHKACLKKISLPVLPDL